MKLCRNTVASEQNDWHAVQFSTGVKAGPAAAEGASAVGLVST